MTSPTRVRRPGGPTAEVARLTALSQAGELLAGSLDRRRVAALAAQLIVPRLGDWAVLFPPRGHPNALTPEHVWHREEQHLDMLGAALDGWECSSPETGGHPGPVASDLGPVLSLPLWSRGVDLGTLVVGGPGRDGFSAATVALAVELSARIAAALDNARLYAEQLENVRGLQRSLLPHSLPDVPGLDIAYVYEASSAVDDVQLGGDFYDVFPVTPKVWAFAVGDVCGTGPEAAALTGLARHSLRLLAREGRSPVSVVERLNQAVLEEVELAGDAGRFITLLYGEIEPRPDGSAQVVLVCAGHPLPLVLRQDGTVRAAANPQVLLGVLDEPGLYAEDLELAPGEVLLGYTDGASERRDDSGMLGDEGVAALLAGCSGMSAAGVVGRIGQAVADYGPSMSRDDLALLALRACPRP